MERMESSDLPVPLCLSGANFVGLSGESFWCNIATAQMPKAVVFLVSDLPIFFALNHCESSWWWLESWSNHQTFQVPSKWRNPKTYISCMDTAIVNPTSPKKIAENKVTRKPSILFGNLKVLVKKRNYAKNDLTRKPWVVSHSEISYGPLKIRSIRLSPKRIPGRFQTYQNTQEVQVDQTACPLVGSGILNPWIIFKDQPLCLVDWTPQGNWKTISSWWLNQPNGEICASQIGSFPQGSG